MQNINLTTDETSKKNTGNILEKNTIVALIILGLILVLYGAILFLNKNVVSKIEETNRVYKEKYDSFLKGNANEIIDYKNRSETAKTLSDSNTLSNDLFRFIEESLVPSVYLNSYEYEAEEKTVMLSIIADNFNTVSKQVLSFKESGYFSELTLQKIIHQTQDKGLALSFDVVLKIK
jgi:hypothetical protein